MFYSLSHAHIPVKNAFNPKRKFLTVIFNGKKFLFLRNFSKIQLHSKVKEKLHLKWDETVTIDVIYTVKCILVLNEFQLIQQGCSFTNIDTVLVVKPLSIMNIWETKWKLLFKVIIYEIVEVDSACIKWPY